MERLARWMFVAALAATPAWAGHRHGPRCGHRWSWDHRVLHRDLELDHDRFHWYPHSKREHRRFHKELKWAHRDYHRDSYYYPRHRSRAGVFFFWGR